jgi:hypothetical protein
MNVNHIDFSQPKKIDGNTYVCQLYRLDKTDKADKTDKTDKTDKADNIKSKKTIKISFNDSKVISLKKNTSDYVLTFKNRGMNNFMDDLNSYIIENVKKNYQTWFVSNMNPELIDDYYSTTLAYNKEHGDIIKLRCINLSDTDTETLESAIEKKQKANISIIFKNLRFYKQKFVLECIIDECEIHDNKYDLIEDNIDDEVLDENEFPEPDPEEIRTIKNNYISKLKIIHDTLENEIANLDQKKMEVLDNISSLELTENFSELIKISEEIEIKYK